ncbi:MAG: CoA transferase [Gracilibacteraceae bacterium]|nr:CoA transferase [Gracilibacteraceae bacterium]
MAKLEDLKNRPLSGIKVVELATFVAAPAAARFLADHGADVIKVETLGGDGIRWAAEGEGRPVFKDDMSENLTFEIENGNKRSISLNLKNKDCFDVLLKLIAACDILITSWRPQALARMGLDYESLKVRFPKLIYATVTGFGEKGPDCDLPGYDFTAFWTRSGILGSLYEAGETPMNLIPSMGDRATGMSMAAGVLAALFNAQRTGRGEKISVSLMGTAIFMQGTMIQTAQYDLIEYPITKRQAPNPLMTCFKTRDDRWVQIALPIYNAMLPGFAKALGREEWLSDPRYNNFAALSEGTNRADMYNNVAARFAELTAAEVSALLSEADVAFAVAQVWKEVLQDAQAWANDCFFELEYKSGTRTAIRNPVQFAEAGLAPISKAPRLGEHTAEIMRECGVSAEKIAALAANQDIKI